MRAVEARKITADALTSQEGEVGKRLGQCYEEIAKCAKNGESSMYVNKFMQGLNSSQKTAFVNRLKAEGYEVEYSSDQRDCDYYACNWGGAM